LIKRESTLRRFAEKIILYVNVLAALLLLLSYSAPLINPGRILFPAFLGLAYPYILLVNLIFLIYWIIRFKKRLLISLVAILLGWGHLMNFLPMNFSGSMNKTAPDDTDLISIMSYNVRTFDQYNWSKKENSTAGIFQLISEKSPDILCIQEFLTINKPGMSEKDVKKYLKDYPYQTIYYNMKSGPDSGIGIATFSKYPIIKTSRIPFDQSLNQAVYTDINTGRDTIRVFNIHLQSIRFGQNNYSFMDTLSLKYSNRQLEEVKDIGKRLKDAFIRRAEQSTIIHNYITDSPYPVIVAGDFNDTPTSYAYRMIKKGLNDAFREAGRGFGNTYAGELPSYRIDFILYSKELKALTFDRVKSKYSDHFPITTVLHRNNVFPE
jgi:endonuclease/exonuclease/phosphatase family metal-dependent hydrolase